jgi:hypothetical protein
MALRFLFKKMSPQILSMDKAFAMAKINIIICTNTAVHRTT